MVNQNRKCKSKYGPAGCGDPQCPELTSVTHVEGLVIPQSFETVTKMRPKVIIPVGAWTKEDTVLLKTIHGSKLYGLNHKNSDEDFYVVTPTLAEAKLKRKTISQTIIGNDDTTYVDFQTFTKMAEKGTPQALEAMFSRKINDSFFEDYRNNFYCSSGETIHTYMRTIKNFSLNSHEGERCIKLRRHALRLAVNLEEILYTGRFNPTLNRSTASQVKRFALYENKKYFTELKKISPIEIDWDETNIHTKPNKNN